MQEDNTILEEMRERYNNPKPKEQPKEAKKQKKNRKPLIIAILVLLVLATTLTIIAIWAFWVWSQHNELSIQTPITIQAPLTWQQKQKIKVLGAQSKISQRDKQQIIYDAGLGDIVSKIHVLESEKGTAEKGHHVECNNRNMSNDFGYFPDGNHDFCFATFEDSAKEVTRWFSSRLEEMPLPIVICYYNTGIIQNDCQYLQDYKKL